MVCLGWGGGLLNYYFLSHLKCSHLLLLHLLTYILICNNNHYHLCARPHVEHLNTSSLSLQSPEGIALWAAFYSWFGKLILEAVSLLKVTG